jgi:molybdate transport system substrate-binding protein
MKARAVAAVLAAVILAACSPRGPQAVAPGETPSPAPAAAPNAERVDLLILGAASLRRVLEAVEEAYEAAHPGTTITIWTDSSAALATQIELGAPADVFLSADTVNAQRLVDAGLADGEPVVFAENRLTIIVPTGNPAAIASPADLARPGLRIVAAGEEVPITKYAAELLANLAEEPGYPSDFAAAYEANVVSREDNVKAVVAKIELGEGDAGIVYVTDAAASGEVETVAVPDRANVRAHFAGVVIEASRHRDAARAFLAWFAGSAGQAILARFGFLPPAQ